MSIRRATLSVLALVLVLGTLLWAGPPPQAVQVEVEAGSPNLDAGMPAHWFGPGPLHKAWIGADEAGLLGLLADRGAVVASEDYGSFTLAVVDEEAFGGREALRLSGVHFRDELDLMVFNGIVLDGTRPEQTLGGLDPREILGDPQGQILRPDAGLYLVQFAGPVRDAWLEGLADIGVRTVQYSPNDAYVVRVPPGRLEMLASMAAALPHIQYVGVYEPAFRMTPAIRRAARGEAGPAMPVTVQLVNDEGVAAALEAITQMADSVMGQSQVGPYINLRLTLRPESFHALAANPFVFAIEQLGEIVRLDEAQGQIVAGNLSGGAPSSPDYLSWLSAQGFDNTQFGSFSVNVVDDATSLSGHPDLASGRIDFALNPTGQGGSQGGHGFLNAHIVSGFNTGTGSAYEDAWGYQYGLGIAPWAHVGSTAIFGSGGLNPTSWESSAYGQGARISTNSWSFQTWWGGPVADYDSWSQEYDTIARDASGTTGNQDYLIVFAAGNSGSGANTVSSPATAKNVLTVGAGENFRPTGSDGCGIGNAGANNADDIISFSSRGPVNSGGGDGRWKPEIVAPGTHIQAGVPQSNYNGSSVCNAYWPSGQTLYGWSSGTSHSTPAVAGGGALVYQWFLNNGYGAPSAAMVKAVLVNGGEYMTGVGAGGNLPSNSQGMGRMNLGRSVDAAGRILVDQTDILAASGASAVVSGSVQNPGLPFRVTLVWTDAPGSTTGAPWVNDLDLTVTVGGSSYRGNVFSGSASTTGGNADTRNNTESVFVPAGVSGAFTVTVDASSIAGDGVPGNGDSTDQDFALVVYNATTGGGPTPPTADFSGTPTSGTAPLDVAFTDASTGLPTGWSWNFGDGGSSTAQDPSHTYASAGTYTVSLTATNAGGSDTRVRAGYISVTGGGFTGEGFILSKNADFSTDDRAFTTSDTIHMFVWTDQVDFNNLKKTEWELRDNNKNRVKQTMTSNGDGTYSASFALSGLPSSAIDWTWKGKIEDNTKTKFNPTAAITVTVGGGGPTPPTADFTGTPTSGTAPLTVAFTDASTGAPTGWSWDFGDGGTSTAQNPSHTYNNAGTYNVSLTATNADGSDTLVRSNYITVTLAANPPVADFTGTPTSGTAPLAVAFTDASTGSPTSWAWDFGDGVTSTAQNPSHTYNNAGTYTVSLTATNADGSDTLVRTNYITVTDGGGGFTGEGFILSKNADFSTDDRTFTRADTIYMLAWSDQVDFNNLKKTQWELRDNGKNKVKQNMTSVGDGTYTASFPLSSLPSTATAWTWKGKIEDNTKTKFNPTAAITVSP